MKNPYKLSVASTMVCGVSALMLSAQAAYADTIEVTVSDIDVSYGKIGCALHADASRFPMEPPTRPVQWLDVAGVEVVCAFTNVKPGFYAISVAHDRNGNQRTDTNFLGIPTEEWGVSGNTRPNLRAPRFDEAQFEFTGQPLVLTIEID